MVWITMLVAAAAILCATVEVILILRKRGGVMLRMILALVVLSFGTIAVYQGLQVKAQLDKDCENVYLGLCYLQDGNNDAARVHFAAVSSASGKMHFVRTCGEVMLEQQNGNDTLSLLKLDSLRANSTNSKYQIRMLEYFEKGDRQSQDYVSSGILGCVQVLGLNSKKLQKLKTVYQIEEASLRGEDLYVTGGAAYTGALSDARWSRMRISTALSGGDYYTALQGACALVEQSPAAENRMLLAEVIAEATYDGVQIRSEMFGDVGTSGAEEIEKLQTEAQQVEQQLSRVDEQIQQTEDETRRESLQTQKDRLYEQWTEKQNRANNIYAYRALNSISDIHTVQSRILQARLYYSMREYDTALEMLADTADSLEAKISTDTMLQTSLQLVKNVYGGKVDSGMAGSQAFAQSISVLSSNVLQDVIAVNFSNLSAGIGGKILSDLKYQSNILYVVGFDDAAYPQITVTLAGNDTVLNDIRGKTDIIVNDTKQTVDYEVIEGGAKQKNSVCIVVDVSGSMSGDPIYNAQKAISDFMDTYDPKSKLALVSFAFAGELNVPLTQDRAALQKGVNNLFASGGTNITGGISVGLDALEDTDGVRSILLLTDGQSDVSESVLQRAIAENITIYTVGFGDVNDNLLQMIAEQTNGKYTRADSSSELSSVYASLGGLIGNRLTLRYTAPETDELPRYFFVHSDAHNCSARYTYRTAAAKASMAEAAAVTDIDPQILSLEQIQQMAADQRKISVGFSGSGLLDVTDLSIGGVSMEITEQRDGWLRAEMPPSFGEGVYDAALTFKDGSCLNLKSVLTICPQDRILYGQTYSIGALQVQAQTAAIMSGTQIVLDNLWFQDGLNLATEAGGFRASAGTAILCTVENAAAEPGEDGRRNLGANGSFTMDGVIFLDRGDSSVYGQNNLIMASGELLGTCSEAQCIITERADG